MPPRQGVVITGCSSGIGLDAAHHLRARGWRVLATCRKPEDVAARRAEGFESFALDLNDPASIAAAPARAAEGGPVTALVNNAAIAIPGAVEDIPAGALRAIFETNLFGTHDLTRAMIPQFRAHDGPTTIVNISSVLGLVGAKWRGAYVASKFALEGLTDVLRQEMEDTQIRVVLVEPGPITSRFRLNAQAQFARWIDWEASPRAGQYRARLIPRLYKPATKDRFELPPAAVSRVIARAIEADRPAPRYHVTVPTRLAAAGRRLLPTRGLDWMTRRS
ncbi:SDR family NAD(P)-dependent oxidoreductase [Paracoccus sp. S-4012]|uniref:SDR family NAD(P)-dependent oxidoreductase n=1 Tax=Paracoccus sp. S-4012 TaxID=2665648 RepID=UPI0012B0484A|nr:SDR family NAD(P)-dependent oxidoreductase [Paracoccus sp. S-4012]MRX50976.1 SDR family NAD(P)-dependent oxidoreductase [Paracoccus sp. S-4012]